MTKSSCSRTTTTSSAPRVACVVLNLNGRELLLTTLRSLARQTFPGLSTIVVDNASTDGSQAAVRAQFPALPLLDTGSNLGFGGGNNVGMQRALDEGADWVFLLNNDTEIAPDAIARLVEVGERHPRAGVLGAKIYFFDRPDVLWYAGGVLSLRAGLVAHRGIHRRDRGDYDTVEDTGYVTGCAMLLRASMLREIGLFDPAFHPAYGEDADLCLRARRAGWRTMYVPAARVWHKVSSFSGGGRSALKTRLKAAHNLRLFRRHASGLEHLTWPFGLAAQLCVSAGLDLLHGRPENLRALGEGLREGLG